MSRHDEQPVPDKGPRIGWAIVSCVLGLLFLAVIGLMRIANQHLIDEAKRTGAFAYPSWFGPFLVACLVAQILTVPGLISGIVGLARALPGLLNEEDRSASLIGVAAALVGLGLCGWGVYVTAVGVAALGAY